MRYLFFCISSVSRTKNAGSNTLVVCQSEKSDDINKQDFLKLFPKLLNSLNVQRKAGVVVDIYYMQKLDQGVVFVVTNKTGDSEAKAKEIVSGFHEIHKEGGSDRRVECKYIAVGAKVGG